MYDTATLQCFMSQDTADQHIDELNQARSTCAARH